MSHKSAKILCKLVSGASCPFCKHYYDEPELGSCGHRMCKPCWKNKKKCPKCSEDIDHEYLQKDNLMLKLASAVKSNLEKFSKLNQYREITDQLSFGKGWFEKIEDKECSDNKKSGPVQKQILEMSAESPLFELKQIQKRIVVKTIGQEDFDKIEKIDESQVCLKDKENAIRPNTEDFFIENSEDIAPRRSSRNKPALEEIKQQDMTKMILTEAVVEVHSSVKQNTPLSNDKCNKQLKQNNWKNIKKMKKEFSKLNKRDVKKLNVSIEMCKKTQSVISKQNSMKSLETKILNEQPITIEDNTQNEKTQIQPLNSQGDNISQSLSLPEVTIENKISKEKSSMKGPVKHHIDNIDKLVDNTQLSLGLESKDTTGNQCSEPGTDTAPTETCSDIQSKTPSKNSINDEQLKQSSSESLIKINGKNSQCFVKAQKNYQTKVKFLKNKSKQGSNSSLIKKIAGRPTAKVHPSRQQKILNKSLPSSRFNPFNRCNRRFERRVSILNISTPAGNFVITGENICIVKSSVPLIEKAIQTDNKPQSGEQIIDIPNTFLHALQEPMSSQNNLSKNAVSQTKNNKQITGNVNTASVDAATGLYKITESVEKELVKEMEGLEDVDIFNTCSGEKVDCISRDIFNTEMVNPTQGSQIQRNKRQRHVTEEPFSKKSKNDKTLTQNTEMKQQKAVTENNNAKQKIMDVNNECDGFTHEFEEITDKAFAQIDADLYEENNKKSSLQKLDEIEMANENFFDLNTPKSTQNKIMDHDSDSSIVEETPQKDKTMKQPSFNNAQALMETNNNVGSSVTKNTNATQDKQTKVKPANTENVDSPNIATFSRGITDESTPVRSASRRSLNFSKINLNKESDHDNLSSQNDSVTEIAKTTLEKEFMEKAFEPSQKVFKKQMSLRKELVTRKPQHFQLACSCLSPEEKMRVINFAKKQKWEFVETYTPRLTHLIVGVEDRRAQRTVKYVSALAGGKWILSYDWITQCIKSNFIVDEAPYEALDSMGDAGPYLSRTSKTKLFEGILFYCLPPFNMLEQKTLEDILQTAGGKITKSIDDVSLKKTNSVAIVIAEPQNTLDQVYTCLAIEKSVVPVNYEWTFNCLGSYCLQPLILLCPSSLVPTDKLNWPRQLFDHMDTDDVETQ